MDKKQNLDGSEKTTLSHKDFEDLENIVSSLERENAKLKILLKESGINSKEIDDISDVEAICVQQIEKIDVIAKNGVLSLDETRTLDLLHKNLKIARGEMTRGGKRTKVGKLTEDELMNAAINE